MSLQKYWQTRNAVSLLLWPVSLLFGTIVFLRKKLFDTGVLASWHAPLPVVVVGNIAVGGTGKTPLTVSLVQLLKDRGYKVGVVSRGYGSEKLAAPLLITSTTTAAQAGDEPVMISHQSAVPVCVFPERKKAIEHLLQAHTLDLVLCDDGLQHYALQRDMEIAVMDAERMHGNGFLMPAGPLRESVNRLQSADMRVVNRGSVKAGQVTGQPEEHEQSEEHAFCLQITGLRCLDQSGSRSLDSFKGLRCHAIAGIANPYRFFAQLELAELDLVRHAMPDHHRFSTSDFTNLTDHPVLMTEKDAVKCKDLALDKSNLWYTETRVELSKNLARDFVTKIEFLLEGKS